MRAVMLLLSLALLQPATCMVFRAAGGGMGMVEGQDGRQSPAGPIGYASLNGGTTGGAAGPTVTVSTAAAFRAAVGDDKPRIVRLTAFLRNVGAVFVGSSKTILGVSSPKKGPAGFNGSSLVLSGVRNVIIRNLKMQFCHGSDNDCISINKATQNVWVDHNEFSDSMAADKDTFDGLVDVTQGSKFVTISYNYFHDHHKCMLLGNSDTDKAEAALRVTVHNNRFYNVGSRLPSVRFGQAHIFNNLYRNVENTGISSRMGAQLLIEGNVFINVSDPVVSDQSLKPGFCVLRDNIFPAGATVSCPLGKLKKAPYAVTVRPANTVQALVMANAGVGVIKT